MIGVLGLFILNFSKISKLNIVTYLITKNIVNIFGGIKNYISIRKEYDSFFKKQVDKIYLAIPSFGCSYYFNNGGCSMCGFNNEIKKYKLRLLSPSALTFLVKCFVLQFESFLIQNKKIYNTLTIYMAGSFINREELPLDAQNIIINFFTESYFEKLCIESRPEYIKPYQEKLKSFNSITGKKFIDIALGYESNNDIVRNVYLKKNITKKSYIEALSILKSIGIVSSTYILIGSQFMKESVLKKTVIDSIIFAWKNGSVIVNIEIGCVQKDTPWERLYHKNKLKLPSLWTIREILLEISKISNKWYLGELSDWPKPIKTPGGCEKCEKKLLNQFHQVRKNHCLKQLEELTICDCYTNNRRNK